VTYFSEFFWDSMCVREFAWSYAYDMLTEIYIEALLADEELADQVWEAWDKGEINHAVAYTA
jgi:hypothetical protein